MNGLHLGTVVVVVAWVYLFGFVVGWHQGRKHARNIAMGIAHECAAKDGPGDDRLWGLAAQTAQTIANRIVA